MAKKMDAIMPIGVGEMPDGGKFSVGLSPERHLVFGFAEGMVAVKLSDVAVSVRAAAAAGGIKLKEKLRSSESLVVKKQVTEEEQ